MVLLTSHGSATAERDLRIKSDIFSQLKLKKYKQTQFLIHTNDSVLHQVQVIRCLKISIFNRGLIRVRGCLDYSKIAQFGYTTLSN